MLEFFPVQSQEPSFLQQYWCVNTLVSMSFKFSNILSSLISFLFFMVWSRTKPKFVQIQDNTLILENQIPFIIKN